MRHLQAILPIFSRSFLISSWNKNDALLFISMQNKITSEHFRKSQSNSNYYRSIRYRINTTIDLSATKTDHSNHNKSCIKTISPSITRNTQCFSTGKGPKIKIFTTIQNEQSGRKYKKMSYLQTWRTLLDKVDFKGPECEMGRKAETVALPSIKEFEQSQFTILDPMNISIDYVQKQLKRANLQNAKLGSDLKQLRRDLETLKNMKQSELQQVKSQFIEKLAKLKQFLVLDGVKQQQLNMRVKRQCKQLISEEKVFKIFFQSARQKVSRVQQVIFQSRPYDLTMAEDQNTINKFSYF